MQYIDSFLKYIKYEKRYSPLTAIAYNVDLTLFSTYMESQGILNELNVKTRNVRNWIMHLLSEGMKARSVNRKIAAIRSFYKYLCKVGLIDINPCSFVNNVKTPKRLPMFLSSKDMDLMLDECDFEDTYEGVRDKTILELFYSTGMRLSELVELTDNQLDMSSDVIIIKGKGSKQRNFPMTKFLKLILKSYLQRRNLEFDIEQKSSYLFLTKNGDKIYQKLVYRIVHHHIEKVSEITQKSPHILRHTFATVLFNNGADIMAIKELLGHSSLAATQIYAHVDFKQMNKVYKQAHPWAKN